MTSHPSPYKSKGGMARLNNAIKYSLRGLAVAFRHEAAFRQELLLLVMAIPVAIWLGESPVEIMVLLAPIVLVLIVELLNSGIEAVADTVTLDHHPLIGRAKDLGSAAVFLSVLFALIVWAVVIVARFVVI